MYLFINSFTDSYIFTHSISFTYLLYSHKIKKDYLIPSKRLFNTFFVLN